MSGPDPTGKPGPAPFTCPRCGAVSHHPDDLRFGYCGACHDFTDTGTEFVFYPDEAFSERVRDKVRHHHYQNYLQQEQP